MRNVDNTDLVHMLRTMAWERTKGELHAILATYHGEPDACQGMSEAIAYIEQMVEEDGLC